MENHERLFKEAERLKPRESLWRNIAAAVAASRADAASASAAAAAGRASEVPAKARLAALPVPASGDTSRATAQPAGATAPQARPWRLAASLAVGLGMVAALAVLFREPPGMAAGAGAADSAVSRLATGKGASAANAVDAGNADGGTGDVSPADGLQEWHADLGIPADERFEAASAGGWADEALLFDPLEE